ncbi:MAG: alpha/beta hydrolase [Pseudomonadota bacterium]
MATFVLLHGAWHGGWCWAEAAGLLRARGHAVTTPTQTGLGERRHLLSPEITLSTFVEDLVQHLENEDLTDVVLVGHSFGGNAISGAAERVPGRIARLVYLDAQIVEGGECPNDCSPPERRAARAAAAQAHDGGLTLPAPSAAEMGVLDPEKAAWLEPRLTPHPWRTHVTPLPIDGPPGGGLPKVYVRATDPAYAPLDWALERARAAAWRIEEITSGHDCMVAHPLATAELLEAEAARPLI